MKALFAIKSTAACGGGAERVLADLVNGLVGRGHEIGVITFDQEQPPFYRIDERVQQIFLGFGDAGQSLSRGRLVLALPRIRRAVQKFKPSVVVGFMHSAYVPLGLASLGLGAPLVASEHTTPEHFNDRWLERAIVRLTAPLFSARTVVSNSVRAAFLQAGYPDATVLDNPVDLDRFLVTGRDAVLAESRTILVVGGMRNEKAHSDAIAAFALISDAYPDWVLRIVGDGSLRSSLERQVYRLGLSGRVEMPGVSRDMAAEYRRAAFLFVPSHYESFGLAAAEAMACARPVLAARDCVGVASLIDSGVNGWLVAGGPDRVSSFAEGLARLMSDAQLRARLGGMAPPAVERFSVESAVLAWEEFLSKIERRAS